MAENFNPTNLVGQSVAVDRGDFVVNGVTYRQSGGKIYRIQNGNFIPVTDNNELQMLENWAFNQPANVKSKSNSASFEPILIIGGIFLLLYLSRN